MDSFELNKIAGAFLGTLLLAMGLSVISGAIFTHTKLVKLGYPLPAAQETAAAGNGAPAPSVPPIEKRLAQADVKKGEVDTKPCQSCHNFEKGAGAKIGPPLFGIVDRLKGSVAGFEYSDAIKSKGGKWTYDDLDQFLANPMAYAQGTKMAFAGETDPAKRADLIDYLHTLSDDPEPLPVNTSAQPPAKTAGAPPAKPESQPATPEAPPAKPEAPPAKPEPTAMAETPGDPKAVKQDNKGKYLDGRGDPTFNVKPDGMVDWYTYSGFRRYHSECHVCHGPDAEGSTYAPALKDSVKRINYAEFYGIVVGGKRDLGGGENKVMPALGDNKNVMCYIDDIYVYLRSRSDDAVPRGRPATHEEKPPLAADAEKACLGEQN